MATRAAAPCAGAHAHPTPASAAARAARAPAPRPARAAPSALAPAAPRSGASTSPRAAGTGAATAPAAWEEFAAAADGEWTGVTATFSSPDGAAEQLPEHYVPAAYREWGVELRDWQSQCSARADAGGLRYALRRLMPTVGCEADAVAFTQEEEAVFSTEGDGGLRCAVAPDGSYAHGPEDISGADVFAASFESCLALDAPGWRLRAVHRLARRGAARAWRCVSVELHRERRDGPWTGRQELAGCGGGLEAFSGDARFDLGVLAGAWAADGLRFAAGAAAPAAVAAEPWSLAALPGELMALPLGAFSAAEVGEGGDALLAAGALLPDGRVRLAVRELRGGRFVLAELLTLRRA